MSPAFAFRQASAAAFDEKNDMLSQPSPRTTTTPAGRASTIRSPSTTTRSGAPLSRADASTTVRFAVSAETPSASMAQRAKAGLPPGDRDGDAGRDVGERPGDGDQLALGHAQDAAADGFTAGLQLVEQPVGFGRRQLQPLRELRGRRRAAELGPGGEQPVAHRAPQALRPSPRRRPW